MSLTSVAVVIIGIAGLVNSISLIMLSNRLKRLEVYLKT